ncbi:hypothetical protein EV189_1286 [Motilibacter rhizosphaerae]|uniref:ScyD/ScyE family protein n=1 Tax=Motilibacter rhizosphaerae TaxID=598652 RepID=A0A4V2F4J3_9ACTN|nr:ScyD/ScyE family protein [Motilibacter rhizosphaerae]RZS89519.1 hypothetical protein EV189_1286 [Motilibacter rhizosphaerae]
MPLPRRLLAAASLLCLPAAALAVPAQAATSTSYTVVAGGLEGPRELSFSGTTAYVATSDDGQVRAWSGGTWTTLQSRLGGTQGVAMVNGDLLAAVGANQPDDSSAKQPPRGLSATVVKATTGGRTVVADPQRFELAHNPDGQTQFGKGGVPLDALSNPYYLIPDAHGYALLADAGANDILRLNSRHAVSLFATLPLITAGACKGAKNNDPKHVGCDPVPTGLTYGPDGALYVSALGGEVEGAVFKLDAMTGALLQTWTGFGEGLTGVAVGPDGTIYASELLHGAPQGDGPPPKGFDPSTVGRIVRVAADGTKTYAAVPMPAGLAWHDGQLWSTAWSVAGLLGVKSAGQLVTVPTSAFVSPAS